MIAEYLPLLALMLGLAIGTLAAFLGIGGGVLFVPTLMFVFGFNVKNAIGTSLMAVLITCFSSVAVYAKHKKIWYRLGIILEGASVPGAFFGAYFAYIAPEYVLRAIFTLFLFFMAINMLRKEKHIRIAERDNDNGSRKEIIHALALSFIAGFLSASLGIGGGVLKVPIMVMSLNIPIHYAVGTSVFMIVITASAGLIQHMLYGHVNMLYGILLGIGSSIGAQIGARISLRTKPIVLRRVFGVLLIVLGMRMLMAI